MKTIIVSLVCVMFSGLIGALKMSSSRGLNEIERQYILDYHNEIRSQVAKGGGQGGQPGAASMTALLWNDKLAANAQAWADQCEGAPHDDKNARKAGTPFSTAGQNMQQCTHGRDDCIDEAMWRFYDEAAGYSYDTGSCTKPMCTHYTQLLWRDSRFVGCGYNWCAGSTFARFVCNYGPGGNYVNEKPYVKGEACSKCPSVAPMCMDGLCVAKENCTNSDASGKCKCSTTEASCSANGGTYNAAACHCQCPAGKAGSNCQEPCADVYPESNCVYYAGLGYCHVNNMYYPTMKSVCAKTCKMCDALPQFESDTHLKVNPSRTR